MVIDGSFERSPHGWRIVVEVVIRPPDEPMRLQRTRAVIDTGAVRTAITTALATSLCLPPRGKKIVRSARGENYHTLFDFDLGFVVDGDTPRYIFPGDVIQGMEWGGHPEFDVLLGMDIICRGELVLRRDQTFSLTINS